MTRRALAGGWSAFELLWLLLFNLLFFAPGLQEATGFSYIDEACVLALALVATLRLVQRRRDAAWSECLGFWACPALASLALLAAVVAVCFAGNAVYAVQPRLAPVLIDAFAFVKFPVAALSARVVFAERRRLFELVELEAKALVCVMAVLAVANLFVEMGMGSEGRFGLRSSFAFVLYHPTYVGFACAGLSMVLLVRRRDNLGWICGCLFVCALTLRSKCLGFAALACLYLFATRGGRRFPAALVPLCLLAAAAIGAEQFVYYFLYDGHARGELMQASARIASDFFPLGSGFATFGSNVTASEQYYSPLYYEYGLSSVWGLEPGKTFFLSDAFWSTVIGQAGWIGLALYVGMLWALFRSLFCASGSARTSTLCCLCYLLISSTSESAFFNPQAVFLALCLGIAMAGVPSATSAPGSSAGDAPDGERPATAPGADGERPLVSVVVPMYRAEAHLAACVDSILGQTLRGLEVVLVDDGSPDRCGEIAEKYAERDPRVKVVRQANSGAARARNSGIEAATGAYVGFVDADDWVEPDMYERLCAAAQGAGADVALAGMKEVSRGEVVDVLEQPLAGRTLRGEKDLQLLRAGFFGALPCCQRREPTPDSACVAIYRKGFLDGQALRFRDVPSEDVFFLIDVCRAAELACCVDGAPYCYRKDEQPSTTTTFDKRTIDARFELFDLLERAALEEPSDFAEECRLRARRFVLDYSRDLVCLIGGLSVSGREKNELVARVCSGDALQRAAKGYPFWRLPLGQAAFFVLMRLRRPRALRALAWLRGRG